MKKPEVTLQEIINGGVFTRGWFREQKRLIILICALIFLYIYAGFRAQRRHHYLSELQTELTDVRYEQLTIHANLTDLTRQSAVARELHSRGSLLQENNKPVIRLE